MTTVVRQDASPDTAREMNRDLVWIVKDGDSGGRGGGDNTPVAGSARLPGRDRLTVPTARAVTPAENVTPPPEIMPIIVPVKPMAEGFDARPGVIEATSSSSGRGPGEGPTAGDGPGTGLGDGGPGGPGIGSGPGGLGSGVAPPRLLNAVKPNYTAEAMRAKIQGVVVLECVVLPDGTVARTRIVKSLDRAFGLDDEAIKAALQFRFLPGTRRGEPVAVLVTIEVAFTLR